MVLRITLHHLTDHFLAFQEFDLDETFGTVIPASDIEGTIDLVGSMNGPFATHEFSLRVSGFSMDVF